MDKLQYIHSMEYLFSNENDVTADTHNFLDGSQSLYAEWKRAKLKKFLTILFY